MIRIMSLLQLTTRPNLPLKSKKMGWKSIKEKYNIVHTVAVYPDEGICIGSDYVHNIIVIGFDGRVKSKWTGWSNNPKLDTYYARICEDERSGELKRLCQCQDTFGPVFPVYTYRDGRIIKKWCEAYGWPNVTTDGSVMYENTFFQDYEKARSAVLHSTKYCLQFSASHFGQDIRPDIQHIKYRAGSLLRECFEFIYARTIEPICHGLHKNK
jgi:hypothetical protein